VTEIEALAELIERMSGNVIPDREMARLGRVAAERAVASGQGSIGRYIRFLTDRGDTDEWRTLLGHVTVNESYLFRGPQQIAAVSREIIPRLSADSTTDRVQFWSAGCARGEEAVTLAIVLAESLGRANPNWSVIGSDVDENALEEAGRGCYKARAVARADPVLLERYFTSAADGFRVVPWLLERITYRPINLVKQDLGVGERRFQVVFLRNVLIYFRPAAQRRVVARVADTISDRGVMFVGPSESLWQLHSELEPWDLGDCFCYRRPDEENGFTSYGLRVTGSAEDKQVGLAHRSEVATEPVVEVTSGDGEEDRLTRDELIRSAASMIDAGDLEGAATVVMEGRRRMPDDAGLRAIEGRILDLTHEPERAVGAYRAALYLEPRLCVVRYLLADCLDRLGRKRRAKREARAVLASMSSHQCKNLAVLDDFQVPLATEVEDLSRELLRT